MASLLAPAAWGSESVILQLPFQRPQFQFAGYYVAQKLGYYRDLGIDIELLPTPVGIDLTKVVGAGSAEFGVLNSAIMLARLNGAPLVVLADIMQHSPLVLFALKRPELQKLSDFAGRKIEIPNIDRSLEIDAMLAHAGISRKSYQRITDHWGFDDLINGKVDALTGFITAQSYALDKAKVNYQIFNPRDYGIDYYSDALFTTQAYLDQHGDIVEAVRKATLKGWRYAMAHPEDAIDILLQQPEARRQNLTRPMLEHEAKLMEEFVLPNLIQIGEVNAERWRLIAESLVREGLSKSTANFDGFIYDANAVSRNMLIMRISLIFGIALVITLIIIGLNLHLRRLVRKRTAELEEASRQLLHAQKIQAIGTLANGIGHDINNILGIILLNTTVLLQKTKDPEIVKAINVIRAALERGSRISKQILQFSSNHPPEPEKVQLPQLLEQLRQFLTASLPPSIKLTCKYPREDVWVRGDSSQLYQAFLNLVVNARDALQTRGTIEIEVLAHTSTVEVRVSDNGMGMEPNVAQRVFEPFFTTKALGSGTGLGLSIVHGIITSHGGSAKVESEKGKGTTVRIFLPRQLLAAEGGENDTAPEIIVAEDEVGIRSVLVMALRDEGYRVCAADDGEEAWRLFEAHQKTVRVLVSDVGLPKLSGNDLMQRARQLNSAAGLIAISGFVEDGQLNLPVGTCLLQKPFAIETLVEAVMRMAGPALAGSADRPDSPSGLTSGK